MLDDKFPSDLFKNISTWLPTVDEDGLNAEYDIFKNHFQQLHSTKSSYFEDPKKSSLFVSDDRIERGKESDYDDDEVESEGGKNPNSKPNVKMINVLRLLSSFGLESAFPNVYKVYKGICTLPPTSSTAERSFSKLKLIKTKHRSTMRESRLDHLMILSCSSDIHLNLENAIDKFAMKSNLLRNALLYQ